MGFNLGSRGIYTLSGGSLAVPTRGTSVIPGSGSFTQSAAANSVSGSLYVGYSGSGAYNLSGGSLAALNQYVGYSGSGSFSQSGGTNSTTAWFWAKPGMPGPTVFPAACWPSPARGWQAARAVPPSISAAARWRPEARGRRACRSSCLPAATAGRFRQTASASPCRARSLARGD